MIEPLLDHELLLLNKEPPGTGTGMCMTCVYSPCICILTLLEKRLGELRNHGGGGEKNNKQKPAYLSQEKLVERRGKKEDMARNAGEQSEEVEDNKSENVVEKELLEHKHDE